ncbi:MAG: gliding motility-associated C-terminal domain-containing protein [Saprospiraceae bacterium]|nr:gliding motility-associated C-terminal domain-containing protein [Saprospiraceae bacterium]
MRIKYLRKFLLLFSLLLFNSFLLAQKEGNIWYFGGYAGIDFNGANPVALTNGALITSEGCASICDASGNLLFYTDGNYVWNKNHSVMPNGSGLMGNSSSTQSAIIVKKPGSNTIYYLFTVDAAENNLANGLRYSEVDMSLLNGLGDINMNKNILIVSPTCEKIAAIKHKNNIDFWIVTHLYGSNAFHSYLLTSSCLNMTPIISNIGSVISNAFTNSVGYLKASSSGSRIASVNSNIFNFELFDFDNSTGLLSNMMTFGGFTGLTNAYGAEFSPNGNLLYISSWSPLAIYQYNLLAGSNTAVNNSKTTIWTGNGNSGAIQLAPDNNIYCAKSNSDYLGVINNPDLIGISCNYVDSGFYLAGKKSSHGLPTLFNSIFSAPLLSVKYFWYGDSTAFIASLVSVDSVLWNFGDINSGISNSSKLINPKHLFSDTGNFVVTLIYHHGSLQDTIVYPIRINPFPIINLGNDTILCDGLTLLLDATIPKASYLWQNNSIDSIFTVSQSGQYWVEVTLEQCKASDTINVNYNPLPFVDLGNDTSLCAGNNLLLNPGNSNSIFIWQNNSTDSTFNVTKKGTYWVEVIKNNCSSSDTILVNYYNAPFVDLGNDATICLGETIILDVSNSNYTFQWQDNSTNPTFEVIQPGLYWVIVSDSNCSTSDSIIIDSKDCEIIFEMPNVFTPNADGFNDFFLPKEVLNITHITIVIYNRWGQKLFETNNYSEGWDGKFEGKNCPDGTYYWIAHYFDINEIEYNTQGFLSLFRK